VIFYKKIFLLNFLIIILFSIDRFVKWFIIKRIPNEEFFLIWPFKIGLYKNPGIAFGVFINQTFLYFITISILLILILFLIKSYKEKNLNLILALTLIIFGAISNFADRLIYAGVIDFIKFFSISTFNFADGLIVFGIIFWMISLKPKSD
jgi:signal peptidase II